MADEATGAVSQQDLDALKTALGQEVEGLKSGIQAEREKRHAAELQIAELKGKQDAPTPEREVTRAELRRKVDDGSLTEDEMDSLLERQQEGRLRRELKEEFQSSVSANTEQQGLQAELDRYIAAKPDLRVNGSNELAVVANEANRQVRYTGQPVDSLVTQVAALNALYGPSDKLQTGTRQEPETHQESGGDEVVEIPSTSKGLTARERAFAELQVKAGVFKDLDAAAAVVLKYGDKDVRRRHGAKI